MNFFKKLRSENLIPFILFLIILINYIPLFKGNFVSDISNSYAVTTKEMTICFAICRVNHIGVDYNKFTGV